LIAANARYFTTRHPAAQRRRQRRSRPRGVAIDFYGRTVRAASGSSRIVSSPPAPRPRSRLTRWRSCTASKATCPGAGPGVRAVPARPSRSTDVDLKARPGQGRSSGPAPLADPSRSCTRRHRPSGWATRQPFDEAGGFNQRGEWMALFGRHAHRSGPRHGSTPATPCARPTPKYWRRRTMPTDRPLLAELADLPITMAQVATLRDQRKQLERPARTRTCGKPSSDKPGPRRFGTITPGLAAGRGSTRPC